MSPERIGKGLDWVQRIQAGWAAIPASAREWITGLVGASLVGIPGAAVARMSHWTPIDAYFAGVGIACLALVSYGLFLRLRSSGIKGRRVAQTGGNLPVIRGSIMTTYGFENRAEVYLASINGSSLSDFAAAYNVVVVGGLSDPNVDKYEDTRISVSPAYTITHEAITVRLKYSQAMLAERYAYIEESKKRFKEEHPEIPTGTLIAIPYELAVWHETVLLPKAAKPTDIRKLSDVPRYNGKILSQEIASGRVRLMP